MSFVLDASVVVAWLLDDEDDPRAQAALLRLETEEARVPHVWHVEVRSALLAAERRRWFGPDEVDDCLRRVRELPVRTDETPDVETAFALARGRGISLDDALYLELARRSDAHLATLDQALAAAVGAAAIPLIETVAGPD
ncbi:MAG: type II toxin-antitoxin system VapC family toxin [Gammaproteobacteria bacterium]|nr:type II toxin-antitoxin system VapC family toxin [Gammaproteobacteria bacterium]